MSDKHCFSVFLATVRSKQEDWYPVFKRIMDIVVSLLALIALSPIFLILAILVKIDSPGPVFIPVRALRKGGKTFNEWKFRTMVEDADEIFKNNSKLQEAFVKKYKLVDDPRVTKIGKFLRIYSLNELPQFFNVLKGDMSLVGPRPVAVGEAERYGPLYTKMLSVPSGITGLWQINGRQDTSYEDRIQFDMEYIDHRSLWLDLKILLLTFPAVVSKKGAY